MSLSKSEWFCYLADDDIIHPNFLEYLFNDVESKENLVAIYPNLIESPPSHPSFQNAAGVSFFLQCAVFQSEAQKSRRPPQNRRGEQQKSRNRRASRELPRARTRIYEPDIVPTPESPSPAACPEASIHD